MAKYQQYAEYKDSGVEWLGEIPSEWDLLRGKWRFKSLKEVNRNLQCMERLALTMRGVIERSIDSDDGLQPLKFSGYQIFEKNDLVFKLIDLENYKTSRVGLVFKKGIMSPAYIRLQPFSSVYPKFFYYLYFDLYLRGIYNEIGGQGVRSALNASDLLELEVCVPNITEQKKIASFLDYEIGKINTLIEKQQSLIKLLKEKRQAVISHAVTKGLNPDAPMKDSGVEWLGEVPEHWEVWKFQHIAPIITCGIASTPTYVDEDEGMPFLSAQNIRDNKLSLHKYNYIPYQLHEQLTKYRKPEMGDLLVTRVGAGIGDACVIDIEMEFSIYVSLTHIRVDPLIGLNKFVMYFFGSDYCKYLNYQGTVTGGGVGNLNVGNVERYKIPLPDLVEQTNIVHYLETESAKFDNLIRKSEQAIQLMQERRTALISAAVTGKIDVRSWQAPENI